MNPKHVWSTCVTQMRNTSEGNDEMLVKSDDIF